MFIELANESIVLLYIIEVDKVVMRADCEVLSAWRVLDNLAPLLLVFETLEHCLE